MNIDAIKNFSTTPAIVTSNLHGRKICGVLKNNQELRHYISEVIIK